MIRCKGGSGGSDPYFDKRPVIEGNLFTDNVVEEGYCLGGGIYIDAQAASPIIRDNIFRGNVAKSSTISSSGNGGAIYVTVKDGAVTITGNRLENNLAVQGGGIVVENSADASVLVERNTITSNDATSPGGKRYTKVFMVATPPNLALTPTEDLETEKRIDDAPTSAGC